MEAFCSKMAQHMGVAKVNTRPRRPIYNKEDKKACAMESNSYLQRSGTLGIFLEETLALELVHDDGYHHLR